MIKTIFEGEVACPAGYCLLHHGALTVKQIRIKRCLDKECWHLERNEEHPWWKQREDYPEFA